MRYLSTINGIFHTDAYALAGVNFQYQSFPHEMRYTGTALFLYASKQLAGYAVMKLNRTRPEGYDQMVVDFSDQPMSLRKSRDGNPYGNTRYGHLGRAGRMQARLRQVC